MPSFSTTSATSGDIPASSKLSAQMDNNIAQSHSLLSSTINCFHGSKKKSSKHKEDSCSFKSSVASGISARIVEEHEDDTASARLHISVDEQDMVTSCCSASSCSGATAMLAYEDAATGAAATNVASNVQLSVAELEGGEQAHSSMEKEEKQSGSEESTKNKKETQQQMVTSLTLTTPEQLNVPGGGGGGGIALTISSDNAGGGGIGSSRKSKKSKSANSRSRKTNNVIERKLLLTKQQTH